MVNAQIRFTRQRHRGRFFSVGARPGFHARSLVWENRSRRMITNNFTHHWPYKEFIFTLSRRSPEQTTSSLQQLVSYKSTFGVCLRDQKRLPVCCNGTSSTGFAAPSATSTISCTNTTVSFFLVRWSEGRTHLMAFFFQSGLPGLSGISLFCPAPFAMASPTSLFTPARERLDSPTGQHSLPQPWHTVS